MTRKIVEDLLLSSENEDWVRKVLISAHVISDKYLDIYEVENRNYFKGEKYNYLDFEKGIFSRPDILVIVDRIISVYIIGNNINKHSKRVVEILGHSANIKNMSQKQFLKQLLSSKSEYSFLQDVEYKIMYFPYKEKTDESPNNYEFYLFREISKNKFLIDSLTNNLNKKDLNIKEGFSRRKVLEIVVDSIYNPEE